MSTDYLNQMNDSIKKNHSIAMACNCSVKYSGRAESFLDFGDRLIIIKADNTILIHQCCGNAPVNYMKPGTSFILKENESKKEKSLVIKARNLELKEYMDINIRSVYFINSHKLEEGCSIMLNGTEKDMSDMIYKNPELIEPDFKPVSQEEQTKFGFIDIFGYDKNSILCVIECKRYTGDLKAVDQLRRYVEKVKKSKGIDRVRGILACPKMTPNASKMLATFGFTHVSINPPKRQEFFNRKQKKLDGY